MVLISKQKVREYGKGLAIIILLLVAWECAALVIDNNYILPSLTEIADVLLHPLQPVLGGESLIANTMVSLKEVLTGFFCAAALAIPLGLLIGWSSEVQAYLNPAIQILRPIPPIAWMPFAIAWCGIRGAWRGLAYGVYHYVPTSEVVGMLLYGLRHPMDAAQALEQPETLDA